MSDEYTESRARFGRRAIVTSEAAKALFIDLIDGYRTYNNFVNPVGKPPTNPNQGGTTTGTTGAQQNEAAKVDEHADGHHPYLVFDIIKAIDELVEFTAKKYV